MTEHFIDLDSIRPKNVRYYNEDYSTYQCCIICGKEKTKADKYVHMLVDGTITDLPYDDVKDDSQGYFEVGNNCAKKLPKSFIIIFKENEND